MSDSPSFDLDAYLARLRYEGPRQPAPALLTALHEAHLAAIPFENLDVRLGRAIPLDLGALEAKLVRRRRGGYCFEQNTLFAAALRAIGFAVQTLEARVRPPGAAAPLPRTHMLLRVDGEEGSWLADVGFGGDGPLLPVPLDGTTSAQPDGLFRVHREAAGVHVLQRSRRDTWQDLYAFTLTPALAVDFEVANHFTSTHPASIFRRALTVQRTTALERLILRGRTCTERRGDDEQVHEVGVEEAVDLLRERFGLEVPTADVHRAFADG